MRAPTQQENLNLIAAQQWPKCKPVSFEQACKNIAVVYSVIKRKGSKCLNMKSWHYETAHCLGGWAHALFDENHSDLTQEPFGVDAIRWGLQTIWPMSHLFDRTELSYINLIVELESFLESVGYDLESDFINFCDSLIEEMGINLNLPTN